MTNIIQLAFAMLLYTASTVSMKYAALQTTFSFGFFALYALAILFLMVYAVLWQNILKAIDLSTAYAGKGLTIIYALLAGHFLFMEDIGIKEIIASIIVILGIYLVMSDGK